MQISVMRLVFKCSIFTCTMSNLKIGLNQQITLLIVGCWTTCLFGSH